MNRVGGRPARPQSQIRPPSIARPHTPLLVFSLFIHSDNITWWCPRWVTLFTNNNKKKCPIFQKRSSKNGLFYFDDIFCPDRVQLRTEKTHIFFIQKNKMGKIPWWLNSDWGVRVGRSLEERVGVFVLDPPHPPSVVFTIQPHCIGGINFFLTKKMDVGFEIVHIF